jgi:hypothetical protein
MEASIHNNPQTNTVTITLQGLNWEACTQASFYRGEVQVRDALQVIGHAFTRELLRSKDVTTPRIEQDGQTYYRKAATPGQYQTPYGEVVIERHLYQSSAGGRTICPLEQQCQLRFGSATPRLAELLSFKLASQTAREVEQDLAKCQGLTLSDTYVREVGEQVGQRALERVGGWHLDGPPLAAPVVTIATGVDGTTMPIVGEAYKETMCGTIALYDADGTRLHTEYLGAMPEAGKATFAARVTARVAQVQAHYPHARHVCLGDGAQWNWDFFTTQYPDALGVLDFYHAATHLHTVAELLFGKGTAAADAYYEHWRTTLLEEAEGVTALLRSLIYYRNRTALPPRTTRKVETELNYFRRHTAEMQYATFRAARIPIGSGVTEAGCKELIKARFCRSGMRWHRPTGAALLHLRAIRLSQYWDSFWAKVMRYAA